MSTSQSRGFGFRSGRAVFTGVSALVLSLAGGSFAQAEPAAPAAPVTEQALADYISAGLKGKPVADSGSSCTSGSGAGSGDMHGGCFGGSGSSSGSSGGYSSDTVGYGPSMTSFLGAFAYGLAHPDVSPPGTNDWSCKPTAEHPHPVIALHGTWMNAYNGFAYMGQPLADAGFCVFTFNYGRSNLVEGGGLGSVLPGVMGTGYIQDSAKQLAAFVDKVRTATGADKVDIVAHSQGGMMANYYAKFEDGAAKIGKMITLGSTHHGTTLDGIGALGRAINNFGIDILGFVEMPVGHAGIQQTVGSDFVNKLNEGGDTAPGIDYTVIGTRYDEITTPFDLTFLKAGPGATVHNVVLQDGCDSDLSDHLTMLYSPRALSIVLHALDPVAHPDLVCTSNPWLIGGGGSL